MDGMPCIAIVASLPMAYNPQPNKSNHKNSLCWLQSGQGDAVVSEVGGKTQSTRSIVGQNRQTTTQAWHCIGGGSKLRRHFPHPPDVIAPP